MKRIWIAGLVLACVLFTGCNSIFLGDTTVVLPQQTEALLVPSAKTGYRDLAEAEKFQGSGEGAFCFLEGRSAEPEDVIQFECLDYREAEGMFVYAYQTLLEDGSGLMATELLGYNPDTKNGIIYYSHITEPNVEPTMFAQKVYLRNEAYHYFIYFGGYGTFFLPEGQVFRQIDMKSEYLKAAETLGNIETMTILSMSVTSTQSYQYLISANFLAERVTVDENTEWTDEMKESDTLTTGDGEEGTVSLRIDYWVKDLSGMSVVNYCDSGKIVIEDMNQTRTEAAPEGFLLEAGMELGGLPRDEDSLLSSEIVGGFVDDVEDIMEERSSEDSEEGQEDGGTEEVLVRQNGVLTPGSFYCEALSSRSGIARVGCSYNNGIRYNGRRFCLDSGRWLYYSYSPMIFGGRENRLDSEIISAGPGGNGEAVIITENKVYMFSGSGRGYEIPLKALDFSVDITVDGGETEAGEPPEETSAGQYGEAYEKEDSGLMDGLDEDAVDRGAEQNQDSVEAGMMETDSYDREQLVNDGVVMDGVIYNPDVEANAEIYRTFNFLESGNGLYISSLNSGLLYYNGETKEVSRVMNYPVFRLWELSDGRYMAVGFDDNSKRYVPSDMAFAKCFRFEVSHGEN